MRVPQVVAGRVELGDIVRLLRNRPQLSRSELSTLLPVTPASLTHQVRDLIDGGWVKEATTHRSSTGGRPPMGLTLDNAAAYAMVVSVGLTTVLVAAVDFGGRIVVKREIPDSMTAIAQGITVISQAIRDVIATVGVDTNKWAGLGIAIPGIWDPDREVVVFSPNLPEWNGMKVGELFRRSTGIDSIIVENDADAATWGELWFGAGRNIQDMMCVVCDVGIGSGLVINGQLVRGQDNSVGEMGHIFVDSHELDNVCGCGRIGCLEAVASLGALNRYMVEGMSQAEALDKVSAYMGMALGSIVNVLCPQVVVLGGATLQTYPVLWPLVVQKTRARVLNHLLHKTEFILSPLGDRAPLLGMAGLVFERRLHTDEVPENTVSPSQWGHPDLDSLKFY